jgi:integrase
MADYLDFLRTEGRDARDPEYAIVAHVLPPLGRIDVVDLTSGRLRRFLADLAEQPARRRTGVGQTQKFKAAPTDEETVRRRRATANRVWGILSAALNHAFAEGRVSNANAWRRVKKFNNVQKARVRYLSVDESRRLLNAADPDFRDLARGGLETGARYGELIRLEVNDYNADGGTITVRKSKSGKPRHVHLTEQGAAFFARLCAGRAPGEQMFLMANGRPWAKSDQGRPMTEACVRGRIEGATFHSLRHTYCSLCAMAGVPLAVIAESVGHRDLRMISEHYGHLAPGFVRDAIRAGVPVFGEPAENVVPIKLTG